MTSNTLPAFRTIALISSLLLLGSAQAHHVWIEQDAKEAKLYFGEFGGNLREASPGLLDKFVKPVAHKLTAKGSEPLQAVKTANGFALSALAARGEALVAEDAAYPISERKEGDKTTRSLYTPAARLVTDYGRQEPRLTLDLLPTGKQDKDGVEVQAFYKGQPLPGAKVGLVTAAGWGQEHNTDEQGKLTVNLPWKGSYVLEVKHTDGAGERGAEKYDRASYVTSLTVMQSEGLAALPAAPAATPNKMN
ncbi:MAG: cobalt ABC transporter substrate-binding protein [Polaromonas sp.]|uniref:cobalt ABC transporter substrate-binding protein n=1 Tax=Polaromonas sp. TaxID=1869339 RepID=UPI002735E464|nr:cobalt ABC transporter substrate-binding protein [Polaromonas sp.]MDP3796230.1 cobalt ABC transporter substrate-binding protein [Polaromonas sp.]